MFGFPFLQQEAEVTLTGGIHDELGGKSLGDPGTLQGSLELLDGGRNVHKVLDEIWCNSELKHLAIYSAVYRSFTKICKNVISKILTEIKFMCICFIRS